VGSGVKKYLLLPELALFIASALLGLSNGMQHTLLSVRGGLEEFPLIAMGIIMALYYLGFLFGAKLATRYIKRVGHIRSFASFASIASATALMYALFPNIFLWAIMRLMAGFCFAVLYVAVESWLHQKANKESRGRTLATYMIIQFIAMSIGQSLINVADPLQFDLFIMLSVIISISLVPLTLTASPGPNITESSGLSFKQLFNAAPLAFSASLMSGFSNSAFFSMTAIYAINQDIKVSLITTLMTAATMGGFVAQWPVGWLSDHFDRRKITFFITTTAAVFSFLLGISMHNTVFMVLSAFILGGALLCIYPVAISIAVDSVETEQILDANAAMQAIYSLGAVIGPLGAAAFMFIMGDQGFIVWLIITFGITALIAIGRSAILPAWKPKDQNDFIPVQATSPITLELDEGIHAEIKETNTKKNKK
jgi:MFS family permease